VRTDLFDDEMFEDDPVPPPKPPRAPRKKRGLRGETAKRVLVALPWIAFAIAIAVAGGIVFALAMIAIGVVCLREYVAMAEASRPLAIPAYLAVAALIVAAHFGTAFNVLMILAAAFPLLFFFGARSRYREGVTISIGVTLLGILWIGIPLVHAVLLRDLPDHGAGLLVDVLVGTFVADTAAYATGRMFGSHKIAPSISPNKTIEGHRRRRGGRRSDRRPLRVDAEARPRHQGHRHPLRPPRRHPRPPRRRLLHDRRRLLPLGGPCLLTRLHLCSLCGHWSRCVPLTTL
jgi:hypothetical protein